jgi:hypothetical protein
VTGFEHEGQGIGAIAAPHPAQKSPEARSPQRGQVVLVVSVVAVISPEKYHFARPIEASPCLARWCGGADISLREKGAFYL